MHFNKLADKIKYMILLMLKIDKIAESKKPIVTLSLFLKTSGTSYVLNGSQFWKKISEGKGWNIGSSMLTAQSYTTNKHKI